MSIATYDDLLTAGANWSARSDLTSRYPEFIALTEAKMNRRLRTKDMVVKNSSFSITGEYVAVPTGFGGVKTFYLNTSPTINLEYMPDGNMTEIYQGASAQPRSYGLQGTNFRFGPVPNATYTATLVYWMTVPALSASNETNWVLTANPDAYLYGINAEACAFAKDFQGAQGWESRVYAILQEIVDIARQDQTGPNMTVRLG